MTMTKPENLARPEVIALTPYASARRIIAQAGCTGEVWMNANESAEGNALSALRLTDDVLSTFNRYPEPQPEEVIRRYAAYVGVNPDGILVTRGGDEGIDLLVRTFCRSSVDAVLDFPPTYGMYSVTAETTGVRLIRLETKKENGWTPDAELLRQTLENDSNVKVVFVCTPNNPTGGVLTKETVDQLIEVTRGRAILVIDEAYIDFIPEASVVNRLKDAPHLVIIRTLSKAFALAGIRCGFLLGSPDVIGMLKKVIAPYPIPVPVAAITENVLTQEGIASMKARVKTLIERRENLAKALKEIEGVKEVELGLGNFILVRFADAHGTYLKLRDRGIILREQTSQPGLTDALRITVGTAEENAKLLSALTELGRGKE